MRGCQRLTGRRVVRIRGNWTSLPKSSRRDPCSERTVLSLGYNKYLWKYPDFDATIRYHYWRKLGKEYKSIISWTTDESRIISK